MKRLRLARAATLALCAALALGTACGANDDIPANDPAGSGPVGELGVVTPEAAREAVLGLCSMAADDLDRDTANAAFFDRSHDTLHVIAAATERENRGAAARLQEAKLLVEQDLLGNPLPKGFTGDVRKLLRATTSALDEIGLEAPECPPS